SLYLRLEGIGGVKELDYYRDGAGRVRSRDFECAHRAGGTVLLLMEKAHDDGVLAQESWHLGFEAGVKAGVGGESPDQQGHRVGRDGKDGCERLRVVGPLSVNLNPVFEGSAVVAWLVVVGQKRGQDDRQCDTGGGNEERSPFSHGDNLQRK